MEFTFGKILDPSVGLQETLWKNLQSESMKRLANPALGEVTSLAITARRANTALPENQEENLAAGLLALVYFGGMNLQCLWVDPRFQGQGLGSKMLQSVEKEARQMGCNIIWGHTFAFQARGFYEKAGYEVFGELVDYPPGQGCVFMKKDL
ncbi:MAG: GNAT family N-acetyltransferase [Leptospiraceae bacterium]|nr:GNAT family N-acetyltransferase [Leptospiraceae bacterium]